MQRLPTWIEIDLNALIHNLVVIRGVVSNDVQIMLIVKADAYGHGAVQIAQAAENLVDAFAVATIDEATELAKAGIRKRLLVISPMLTDEIPTVVDSGFVATVTSYGFAKALSDYAETRSTRAEVHVEVDTGMGRAGFRPEEVVGLIERIARLSGLRVAGLFTHFPVAEADREFTTAQVREFHDIVDSVRAKGIDIPLIHAANSSAIATVRGSHLGGVRPGLSAYGHLPADVDTELDLRPVMHWKCHVVQTRDLPAGATVSYGRTFTAPRPIAMAVLPVGYGHGYPLRMSNRGSVIVGGKRVPIIGRVTMDMTMVDVSNVTPRPRSGDEVVLMGAQGDARITVGDIADWIDGIPYEILTGISKRVPRTYFRNGKLEIYKSLLGVTATNL
jgi:alanine racemase